MKSALAISRLESLLEERAEIMRQTHYDRLAFQYGHDRAHAILDGKDDATKVDLALWRRLGARA